MKTRFLFGILFVVTGAGMIISCSDSSGTKISVTLENRYPVITFSSQGREVVSFVSPDKNRGSIGFLKEGEVTWLKGLPEKSRPADQTIAFKWDDDKRNSIILKAERTGHDIIFSLSMEGEEMKEVSAWIINIRSEDEEFFTGVFERVIDGHQDKSWADGIAEALDLRGQVVEVKLRPTVSAYSPFYISSHNYGFFAQGTWPGIIDFCKSEPDIVNVSFEGPEFSFKIYTAENPMDLVRKHAIETGPSFMPPGWVFGPWRWRDEHFNYPVYYDGTEKRAPFNTDIVEDVLMMEAYDIPFTAYWIDRPWARGNNGFDDYDWDTRRFPDPEGMTRWLNGKNIELMLWIAPFVMGEMAGYAESHNYDLVSKMHGNNPGQVLIDFTNPDAAKWWGENGPGKMARMGIKGFKLDRADGEKLTDSLHLKTADGRSYRENYNDYPVQYVKAAYEAVQPVLGNNFILFPRAQYTGSARYGAMWAGDTDGKPEGLRSALIGMQRCAIMGYPLWASDIGGYWGSFSRETAMRWLAFGCFSPIMEAGPTNNRGFWNNPKEPHYDAEMIAVWRLYSKIRMKLKDYITTQAQKAHDDGTPVARPLLLVFPEQNEAWENWETYMFGPDLLVSPVWRKGASQQEIWLPGGVTWIDAWSSEKREYQGGTYATVDVPLHKIPLFIRKGSAVDLGNLEELYGESLQLALEKPDIKLLESSETWE
jgi:alpha-glucosidase (family GH31 glycosyl hydrolase)